MCSGDGQRARTRFSPRRRGGNGEEEEGGGECRRCLELGRGRIGARFWRAQGSCDLRGTPRGSGRPPRPRRALGEGARAGGPAAAAGPGRDRDWGPPQSAGSLVRPPALCFSLCPAPGCLEGTRLRALPVVVGRDRTARVWSGLLPFSWLGGEPGVGLQPWLCWRRLVSLPNPGAMRCAQARGAACDEEAGLTRPAAQDAALRGWLPSLPVGERHAPFFGKGYA